MSVKHKFTVSKTQSSDPTIVRNNDWNDNHTGILYEVPTDDGQYPNVITISWNPSTGHNHDGSTSRIAQKANQLATPRTISGVAFDGTANIVITPSNIGLGNVDNTHDNTKSVLYAQTAGSAPTVTHVAFGVHALGTTYEYTGSTAKYVAVCYNFASSASMLAYSDSTINPSTLVASVNGIGNFQIGFWVLPGNVTPQYYKIVGAGGLGALQVWTEWN
jgi:hypothetical protein